MVADDMNRVAYRGAGHDCSGRGDRNADQDGQDDEALQGSINTGPSENKSPK